MHIILVVEDKKGKNVLFVLDDLSVLTLKQAIKKAEKGGIAGVHVVDASMGTYLRSNPNETEKDNLDSLTVPLTALTKGSITEKTALAISRYSRRWQQYLKEGEADGRKVICIDGKRRETEKTLIKYLSVYQKDILAVARELKVDKYLLAAILVDEYLRFDWIDGCFDRFALLGFDLSVGIAQVKIKTARTLIRGGFYPADPADKKISPENTDKVSAGYLRDYLNDAEHSIRFVAARINYLIDRWASYVDLSNRPEIIGTLYSADDNKKRPHPNPESSDRGEQIAAEFYRLAEKALK